jgi:DNA mismatch repair protein MutL
MTIRLLDESLINQIAAGEVIERPASIVKELVENSLDAGSTRITVNIGNSGLDTIEVEDNGTGMTGDDLPLAFLRHATSKIKNELDLFKIRSMGFRGEALPSIASVSRIQIISRTEDTEGVCAFLEAGQIIKMEPCAHTRGTRIVVSDLFYNTPVRKKFLKSPVGESRHIYDMVCRYALARPDVSFSFVNEKKTVFKTPGNNSLRDTLTAIYGRDYLQHLVDIRHQGSTLSLAGLVSTPELTRTNRRNQIFFVNRRPVRTPLLFRALDEGYKGLLISRQQPVVILNLSVPAESVDVNVHPQKNGNSLP